MAKITVSVRTLIHTISTVDLDWIDVDPIGDYFNNYNDYNGMEVENPVEALTTTNEEYSDSDDVFNNLTMETDPKTKLFFSCFEGK